MTLLFSFIERGILRSSNARTSRSVAFPFGLVRMRHIFADGGVLRQLEKDMTANRPSCSCKNLRYLVRDMLNEERDAHDYFPVALRT
jgi:hypothetical protein